MLDWIFSYSTSGRFQGLAIVTTIRPLGKCHELPTASYQSLSHSLLTFLIVVKLHGIHRQRCYYTFSVERCNEFYLGTPAEGAPVKVEIPQCYCISMGRQREAIMNNRGCLLLIPVVVVGAACHRLNNISAENTMLGLIHHATRLQVNPVVLEDRDWRVLRLSCVLNLQLCPAVDMLATLFNFFL